MGRVVFVGFLVRGLLYLKHMIAPLIVLGPVVYASQKSRQNI